MTESSAYQRVLETTRAYLAARDGEPEPSIEVSLDDSVCQDLMIFGVDIEDYVWALEKEFGQVVWSIPWLHFTDQRGSYRGFTACAVMPFLLPWMLGRWLLLGPRGIKVPDPREHPHRLTLREVAAAIDAGGWQQESRS